ncbi:MAG: response regulator transcription factor [Atopobiaceae bacterium]|nr:response regulator transcription factor [Atopobiaceae bacterium]
MRDIHEARILVVEDDPTLREAVCELIEREGYREVRVTGTVAVALTSFSTWRPDLLLIDIMLPDGNGFDLLRSVRQTSQVPAIILSARDEDEARLRGLGLGADDYVTKPFLPRELLLRISTVLRRAYGTGDEPRLLRLRQTIVDMGSGEVTKASGARETLTSKEYAILERLARSRGLIVTTDDLARAAWGDDYDYGYGNALMVHVRRLREKVEENPSKPQWILRPLRLRLSFAPLLWKP